MAMNRRHASRLATALLVLALALAALQGWRLQRDVALNRMISASAPNGAVSAVAPNGAVSAVAPFGAVADDATAPPELRFARAHARAADGAFDDALNRYAGLHDATPLGRAARFNSANLLMRQAATLRAGDRAGQALALIELAKEHYREVLRQDPGDWAARYNLERAQRLLPDADDDEDPTGPRRDAERAATTMRGQTLGLP